MPVLKRHWRAAALAAAAFLFAAACDGPVVSPESPPASSSPLSIGFPSTGPSDQPRFQCTTLQRDHTTPDGYRHGTLRLRFPEALVSAADGRPLYLQYHRITPDGATVRFASCVLPRSHAALRGVTFRLTGGRGAPSENDEPLDSEGSVGLLSSHDNEDDDDDCVTNEDKPCKVEEVVAECSSGYDPECDEEEEDEDWGDDEYDYCEDDPDDPMCDEGGGGGWWPTGCGDERDIIIQEYEDFPVTASPTCGSFTQSARTVHFSHAELTRNNPHDWAILRGPLLAAATSGYGLDRWREEFGGPRNTNSVYRCPHHNAAIPGAASDSRHMHGDAADLRNESRTQAEAQAMLDAAHRAQASQQSYIGISSEDGKPGWVHADWRDH